MSKILLIHGLPVVRSLQDLSDLTHISKDRIYNYSRNAEHHYKVFYIAKKSGKKRMIAHPSKGLKSLQAWILRNILDKLHTSPYSFGFEKNSDILSNANVHAGANAVLIIDLKDFFHSIKVQSIYQIFLDIGYPKHIAGLFARICTYKKFLPQGSPCSPKLANLKCISLDNRISNYCMKRGITYSRYADDLTFSATMPQKLINITFTIAKIIRDNRLVVNENKTKLLGTRKKKTVTGLILYDDKVGVGKTKFNELRTKMYKIFRTPNVDEKSISHLNGWLSFVKHVDEIRYQKLKHYNSHLQRKFPNSNIVLNF